MDTIQNETKLELVAKRQREHLIKDTLVALFVVANAVFVVLSIA